MFSDANWGNNLGNGKSMFSYFVFLPSTQVCFRVGLRAQSTIEAELAGNRTYSSRVKHVALRYLFIQELVKKGNIAVKYMRRTTRLLAGTNNLRMQGKHDLFTTLISEFRA